MNIHKSARLTAIGRQAVIDRVHAGEAVSAVARAVGVSRQTIYKWCRRVDAAVPNTADCSSRPRCSPTRLSRTTRRQTVKARRKRWSSRRIAKDLGLPVSTVVTQLRREGLNTLARLEPPRPVLRYERARSGELVHLDIKKLGRIGRIGHRIHGDRVRRARARALGWEYLHVAVDDHSRLLYAEILPDEQGETTAGFLVRATAWYATHQITVERVLPTTAAPIARASSAPPRSP